LSGLAARELTASRLDFERAVAVQGVEVDAGPRCCLSTKGSWCGDAGRREDGGDGLSWARAFAITPPDRREGQFGARGRALAGWTKR